MPGVTLQMAARLTTAAQRTLAAEGVPPEAVAVEVRVARLLAELEGTGIGESPAMTFPFLHIYKKLTPSRVRTCNPVLQICHCKLCGWIYVCDSSKFTLSY